MVVLILSTHDTEAGVLWFKAILGYIVKLNQGGWGWGGRHGGAYLTDITALGRLRPKDCHEYKANDRLHSVRRT